MRMKRWDAENVPLSLISPLGHRSIPFYLPPFLPSPSFYLSFIAYVLNLSWERRESEGGDCIKQGRRYSTHIQFISRSNIRKFLSKRGCIIWWYYSMEHALTGRSKYMVIELKLGLSVHFSLTLTFPPATPCCLPLSILILYCLAFKTICSAQMCYYYRPDYMSVRIYES